MRETVVILPITRFLFRTLLLIVVAVVVVLTRFVTTRTLTSLYIETTVVFPIVVTIFVVIKTAHKSTS